MTPKKSPASPPRNDTSFMGGIIRGLEGLDNLFHMVVGVMFILMAMAVIVHTCLLSAQRLPYIVPQHTAAASATQSGMVSAEKADAEKAPATPPAPSRESHTPDLFVYDSLEALSSILFIVIILELLRTVLTYLQTHNIQAIMREFIVVGIISSVRKILLVSAESSLYASKGQEFVLEAQGTLLTVLGILALVFSLWVLERAFNDKKEPTQAKDAAPVPPERAAARFMAGGTARKRGQPKPVRRARAGLTRLAEAGNER